MAPARSLLHVSHLLVPNPHLLRMVTCIYASLLERGEVSTYVRLCTFPGWICGSLNNRILFRGTFPRAWDCRTSWQEKTAGSVWATRWHEGRCARVRVLLRRLNPRIFPAIRPVVHHSIRPSPRHQTRQQGVRVLRQSLIPGGSNVLDRHHIPRLQCTTFPAPYAVVTVSNGGVVDYLAGVHGHWGQFERLGRKVAFYGSTQGVKT
jgi:hypothetical protein